MTDRRLATLRRQYPAPGSSSPSAPDVDAFAPNSAVDMRYLVFRQATSGADRHFAVDPLFPHRLAGSVDMSGVDEASADLLFGLVRGVQPRVVFETGTHKGRSTRALVTALRANATVPMLPHSMIAEFPRGHVWTVDAEDHGILASGAIPPECAEYVTIVTGWTPDVLTQEPLASLQGIDFAFLDGDHTAEGLDAELTYVDLHRAPECWVAIDNTRDHAWDGIRRTLHEFTKYPRISLATCTGMDLIWMHD